jgi:hypothetical protein
MSASRQNWLTNVLVVCCLIEVCGPLTTVACAEAQSYEEELRFETNAVRSIIPAWKAVFCPSLGINDRMQCQNTPIYITPSWAVGAFAELDGNGPKITFSSGTAAMLRGLAWARDLSLEYAAISCFMEFSRAYASTLQSNTEAQKFGRKMVPALGIVQFAELNPKICPGITQATADSYAREHLDRHTVVVEAGISFILLHELGHIVRGHVHLQLGSLSLERRREIELEADSWALEAAMRARQHLVTGMTPVWLTLLQGSSLDWEQHSDHPLGVRRAQNFFKTLKTEYSNNPDFRRPLENEGTYPQIVEEIQRSLEVVDRCLVRIDAGETISNCD